MKEDIKNLKDFIREYRLDVNHSFSIEILPNNRIDIFGNGNKIIKISEKMYHSNCLNIKHIDNSLFLTYKGTTICFYHYLSYSKNTITNTGSSYNFIMNRYENSNIYLITIHKDRKNIYEQLDFLISALKTHKFDTQKITCIDFQKDKINIESKF